MPRALGQIDVRKTEAILEAAAEVLADRGFGASIEEVARRAQVSKQTIYNHYGSKTELVRALTERRLHKITAALDQAGPDQPVETTLARYGEAILCAVLSPVSVQMARMGVASALDMPDLAQAIYDAGARAAATRLAAYLATVPPRDLEAPDPAVAAEIFIGMVLGRVQYRLMLGLPAGLAMEDVPGRAGEVARRFVRAYARDR